MSSLSKSLFAWAVLFGLLALLCVAQLFVPLRNLGSAEHRFGMVLFAPVFGLAGVTLYSCYCYAKTGGVSRVGRAAMWSLLVAIVLGGALLVVIIIKGMEGDYGP